MIASPPRRLPPPPPADNPLLRARDERLDSIKAAIGKVAHEINNSLVPLVGFATLIKEETQGRLPLSSYANSIEQAGQKAVRFIDELFMATRPERKLLLSQMNFAALLQGRIDEWKKTVPAEIEVITSIEPAEIVGDATHWRRVIDHLLKNATMALDGAGKIEVILHHKTLNEPAQAALGLIAPAVVELDVSDSGAGMESPALERAFEPFFSTRPKNLGMGLGLTIVHSVVRSHGGQVELRSDKNRGTLVRITLPAAGATPGATIPQPG